MRRRAPARRTVEEGRPAAAALELGDTLVERRAAAGAGVHALLVVLVVLPGSRGLGALLAEDAELQHCTRPADQRPRAGDLRFDLPYLLRREDGTPLALALGLAGVGHRCRAGVKGSVSEVI